MSSFKMALRMLRNNLRGYLFYECVLIFAIAMFYNFTGLIFHPQVTENPIYQTYVRVLTITTAIIMTCVLVYFMWSSGGFFLKQRKKEFGLYALAGVSMRRVGLMILTETLLTGAIALAGGLVLGIALSKLFLMALSGFTLVNVTFPFSFSATGAVYTALFFGAIFLIMSLRSYIVVARSRLIDLINDLKKQERPPKLRLVRAILGLLFLIAAYWLIYQNPVMMAIPVVVMVIMGTYWLFGALMPFALSLLMRNKRFFYKGSRMIGIANSAFRIRSNYRSMSMIAVLVACAITALGVSLSLKDYASLLISYSPPNVSFIAPEAQANEMLGAANQMAKPTAVKSARIYKQDGYYLLSRADYQAILPVGQADFVEQLPEDDESTVLLVIPSEVIVSGIEKITSIELGSENLPIKEVKQHLLGDTGRGRECLVVPERVMQSTFADASALLYHRFEVPIEQSVPALYDALEPLTGDAAVLRSNEPIDNEDFQVLIGTFYFLGIIMFAVFVMAVGSAMIFRQTSDAMVDKPKYETMQRIGATRHEIRRSISAQISISLLVPLLLGMVHGFVAIQVTGLMLGTASLPPLLVTLGIFCVLYVLLYAFSTRRFLHVVCS